MNQRASFLRRSSSVLIAVVLTAGCIRVGNSSGGGDDDGCDDDRDCKSGDVCNDDECEAPGSGRTGGTGGTGAGGTSTGGGAWGGSGGACGWYCDFVAACGERNVAECLPQCQALSATSGECSAAFDAFVSCIRPYPNDCSAAEENCTADANNVVGACTACPFTDDGECDEPEGLDLCPDGSDVSDCACPYKNDGECDEPEGLGLCPHDSDVIDCECRGSPGNACMFACDRECDEAAGTGVCPGGSDQWDCARYP